MTDKPITPIPARRSTDQAPWGVADEMRYQSTNHIWEAHAQAVRENTEEARRYLLIEINPAVNLC